MEIVVKVDRRVSDDQLRTDRLCMYRPGRPGFTKRLKSDRFVADDDRFQYVRYAISRVRRLKFHNLPTVVVISVWRIRTNYVFARENNTQLVTR